MASLHLFTVVLFTLSSLATVSGEPFCNPEEVYFGNINESFPEHINKNGIYKKQNITYLRYDVYKHTDMDMYMFHLPGKAGSSGRWMIGPEVGDRKAAMFSVRSDMNTPALHAWRYWRIRGSDKLWYNLPNVRCVCASKHHQRCTTGRLLLTGLSKGHPQASCLGEYSLAPQTLNHRPVYRHENGSKYLYYRQGFWFVGPTLGALGGGMLVPDAAFRPEEIINIWEAFQMLKGKFISVPKKDVRLSCVGMKTPAAASAADGTPCTTNVCQNGGSCKIEHHQEFCRCRLGYFGPKCQYNKSCGAPPSVTGGNHSSSTGQSLMDLAFFQCTESKNMIIAVCESNKQWHVLGAC